MSHKAPINPNKARISKIRVFDGIGGAETQILKRTNQRNQDISSSIANEVQDFDLGEKGSMILRPGMRKIDETGKEYDITSIFEINVGGLLQYGLVFNNNLDLIDIPEPAIPDEPQPPDWPLDFTPQKPDKPADFPAGWPWPEDVVNDYMTPDPSLPADVQICEDGYTIVDSPATLSFAMVEGAVDPTAQNWWFKVEGRWKNALSAVFSTSASWYNVSTTGIWAFTTGPCNAVGINQITIQVDGSGLSADTYTDTLTLTWSDGTVLDVVIGLTVSTAVAPTQVANYYKSGGSNAVWATVLSTMGADTWTNYSLSIIYAIASLSAQYEADATVLVWDSSGSKGLSLTDIDFTILNYVSSAGTRAGRINVQTGTSATPDSSAAWLTGGSTAAFDSTVGAVNSLALSSAVTLDDYLFMIIQLAPYDVAPAEVNECYVTASGVALTIV